MEALHLLQLALLACSQRLPSHWSGCLHARGLRMLLILAHPCDDRPIALRHPDCAFAGKLGAKHQCGVQRPMYTPDSIGAAAALHSDKETKKQFANWWCRCLQI
jgi:hypothetical protein